MTSASHIGHVHLKVADLPRAERFYREVFGMRLVERVGAAFAFLSGGASHHELALQERPGARAADSAALGLLHVAFEVPDETALGQLIDRLDRLGVAHAPADHGISRAVYFRDPDGNGLEAYVDTRHRRRMWEGRDEPMPHGLFGDPAPA